MFSIEDIRRIVIKTAENNFFYDFSIEEKGNKDNIVTSNDKAIQEELVREFRKLVPGSSFVCEEENFQQEEKEWTFVIDPIDGTMNYSRGLPYCCISVGLLHNGIPEMGVIYLPFTGDVYEAARGKGAKKNGKPIHVSNRDLAHSLAFVSLAPYLKEDTDMSADILKEIYLKSIDHRRLGSCAVELCLLAEGKAEIYFELRVYPWDYCAGVLILEEAGGTALSYDHEEPSYKKPSLLIAANSRESANGIYAIVRKNIKKLPY